MRSCRACPGYAAAWKQSQKVGACAQALRAACLAAVTSTTITSIQAACGKEIEVVLCLSALTCVAELLLQYAASDAANYMSYGKLRGAVALDLVSGKVTEVRRLRDLAASQPACHAVACGTCTASAACNLRMYLACTVDEVKCCRADVIVTGLSCAAVPMCRSSSPWACCLLTPS